MKTSTRRISVGFAAAALLALTVFAATTATAAPKDPSGEAARRVLVAGERVTIPVEALNDATAVDLAPLDLTECSSVPAYMVTTDTDVVVTWRPVDPTTGAVFFDEVTKFPTSPTVGDPGRRRPFLMTSITGNIDPIVPPLLMFKVFHSTSTPPFPATVTVSVECML